MLLGLAGLTACSTPQPFRTAETSRQQNIQLDLGARSQLLVTPIRGMPGADGSRQFTDLVVGALRRLDIPALSLAPRGATPLLTGVATEAPGPDATFIITFDWSIIDPTGQSSKIFQTQHTVDGLAWLERNNNMILALATDAAKGIEQAMIPDSTIAELKGVYITPPDTLPGDGNDSLLAALKDILRQKGVTLVEQRADAVIEIQFEGGVSPMSEDTDLVVLIWQVYHVDTSTADVKQGKHIGQIDMANPVPRTLINGPWRNIAKAAAAGSAEGIVELLAQAGVI